MSVKTLTLSEIAEINPSLGVSLDETDEVSFVPMGAFSEVTASVVAEETRQFGQVKKGFTGFRSGDVIFAKITPCFENGKIGLANISRDVGFGSTEFHVIRARPEMADPRFLHHFLRLGSVRLSGTKRMTGSAGQRRVPKSFLESLPVPALPLDEQRRIAAMLDKAEELRAKRRAAIALLDQLPQAIFLKMFGDPATNPQKWPRIPIEALVEKVTNWNPGQLSGEFQYVDISSIDSESKEVVGVRRIAVEDAPSRARQRIQSGDVLVSTVRPNLNAVAVVRDIDDTGTASTGFCVLRPQPKRAVFSYLFCWVRSKPFIESMARQATGASYPAVNDRIVKSFEVFDVPLDLQNVFAARLESIDRIKSAKVHALTEADALFSAAQHAVFGGPE